MPSTSGIPKNRQAACSCSTWRSTPPSTPSPSPSPPVPSSVCCCCHCRYPPLSRTHAATTGPSELRGLDTPALMAMKVPTPTMAGSNLRAPAPAGGRSVPPSVVPSDLSFARRSRYSFSSRPIMTGKKKAGPLVQICESTRNTTKGRSREVPPSAISGAASLAADSRAAATMLWTDRGGVSSRSTTTTATAVFVRKATRYTPGTPYRSPTQDSSRAPVPPTAPTAVRRDARAGPDQCTSRTPTITTLYCWRKRFSASSRALAATKAHRLVWRRTPPRTWRA
mmetsp:Transcript_42554/g.83663  ORF Transcript_42554/g.83663 Transcript_42554/m.83663 type:complete len:281 (+) Transcript_42554:146-988(+)